MELGLTGDLNSFDLDHQEALLISLIPRFRGQSAGRSYGGGPPSLNTAESGVVML